MNVIRFLRKNWIAVLVSVIVVVLLYKYNTREGFATCSATSCKKPNTWMNNKCYKPCPPGSTEQSDKTKCMSTRTKEVKSRGVIRNC